MKQTKKLLQELKRKLEQEYITNEKKNEERILEIYDDLLSRCTDNYKSYRNILPKIAFVAEKTGETSFVYQYQYFEKLIEEAFKNKDFTEFDLSFLDVPLNTV